MKRIFIETSIFSKRVEQLNALMLVRSIQMEILRNPEVGKVISGTGGLRKFRMADLSRSKGKRGGLRVIYLDLLHVQKTYLLWIYGKNEAEDISTEEKTLLKKLVLEIKKELK